MYTCSFDSTQPLSCLYSLVVRASAWQAVSWVRIPPEQLFFLFCEKRVVQVSRDFFIGVIYAYGLIMNVEGGKLDIYF